MPKLAKLSVFITKSIIVFSNFFEKINYREVRSYGIVSNSSRRRFILWIRVAM